ncbi:hypothetical protein DWB78_10595 [Halopelagius longus]|uniref:Uncharacterized protein n=1 Tax=Halopelagius longus TaxID=1236180 RepID=A0A370IN63_9EURY|nr:hypothetical protein DWB78_10595 [Halopelagius longus]
MLSRRRLLTGVATAGAAASLPAFVGGAAAQEETESPAATPTEETEAPTETPTEESGTSAPEEEVTTEAALPTDAPTFDQSDYVGLFVQVTGYDREADLSGVGECGFVENQEDLTAFDAEIFETTGEMPSEQTTLYTVTQQGTVVQSGKLFVVNSQTSCSSDFVTVGLEEVGASSIETPTPAGGSSGGAIPGFDAVAGVLGVGAAAAAAAVRSRGDE